MGRWAYIGPFITEVKRPERKVDQLPHSWSSTPSRAIRFGDAMLSHGTILKLSRQPAFEAMMTMYNIQP
jgi:hypothetical protein